MSEFKYTHVDKYQGNVFILFRNELWCSKFASVNISNC